MAHNASDTFGSFGDSPMEDSDGPPSESTGSIRNNPPWVEPEEAESARPRDERAGMGNRDPCVEELQKLVADLRREVAELRGNQAPRVQVPAPLASPPRRQDGNFRDYLTILEHMRGIGTARFRGTTNPIDADEWFQSLTRNLSVSRCPSEFKKDVAVFFLERDAVHWWKRVERRYGNAILTWEDFQQEFGNKYFPPEARERLEVQFLQLQQGNHSVREYEAEFTRLSHYANGGSQGEAVIIRKFLRGLEPCLRNRLQVVEFRSLHELVERAVLVEEGIAAEKAATRTIPTNSPSMPRSSGQRDGNQLNSARRGGRSGGNGQNRGPFCPQCRSRHSGPCRQGQRSNLCYLCRSPGHLARDCPNREGTSAIPVGINVTCFGCGEVGHYATSCPNKRNVPKTERPALPAPPAKRQAVTARAYALDAGPSGASVEKSKDKAKEPIAG